MTVSTSAQLANDDIDCMRQYISAVRACKDSKDNTGLSDSMTTTQKTIDDVLRKIHCLNDMGYERIAQLCLNVVNNTDGLFSKVQCWNVCALTGMTCNNVIQIRHNDKVNFVHPMFYQFVVSLWLVTRIKHFECEQHSNVHHEVDLDSTAAKYTSALRHVHNVLDATMQKFHINFE